MKPQPYITRDPFNQKDTITVWGILGPPVKIVLIIYASFWLIRAFLKFRDIMRSFSFLIRS